MFATVSIKKRVTLSVICLCCASITVFGFFAYQYQMHQLLEGLQDQAKNQCRLFNAILTADAEGLARAHVGLDRLDVLLKPFAAGNKDELLVAAGPIFNEMRQNNNITHMYFIQPDGKVLLRVHKPEQAGDVLKRTTFLKAQATKRLASGMEMGDNFFSLRCVSPVSFQGKPIGYIEVAEEIDHVFKQMKGITGSDVTLFLTEDFLNSQSTAVTGEKTGNFRMLYPSQKEVSLGLASRLQPEMKAALAEPRVSIDSYRGVKYLVGIGPVQDAAGVTVGVLFSHKEVSSLLSSMWSGVAAYMAILVAILLSLFFLLYLSLRKSLALFRMMKEHIVSVTTAWDLSKRLRIDAHDEIGEIAEDFNAMTEKLHVLKLELEQRVTERTADLQRLNRELEVFCYSISHELRAPIARLLGFSRTLVETAARAQPEELSYLAERIGVASLRLRSVIDSLLLMNRLSRAEIRKERVNLSELADMTVTELLEETPGRRVKVRIAPDIMVPGDRGMLAICMQNLLGNAVKYTSMKSEAEIEFDRTVLSGEEVFFVRDNGAGFDISFADKLFEPFCRLHTEDEFEGSGMGLPTVQRIIERHGGRIWAEAQEGRGATFYFTLGD